MVYTHHSHVTCDDCGTKHIPGNTEACIETLKERVAELEADIADIPELLAIAHMQGAEHAKDRVKALEVFIYTWCDPCHMQEADLRFFNDICQRLEPATDRTKALF